LELEPKAGHLHFLLADVLATKGELAEAWEHVHRARRLGAPVPPAFLEALRERMPEPPPPSP
ncbi:MAG: hypothetical protein ACE5JI_15440, partial [Acidobacteriota bacterium]